jgi:hypothetical protein
MHTTMKALQIHPIKPGFVPRLPTVVFFCLLSLAKPLATCGADNEPPPGFVALFNGYDFSNWKTPEGDNGHWKVLDGVIDYDAESEGKSDKSLWTDREFGDFVLHVDWRIKETPYVNSNVFYILPDGTHARDIRGKELRMALPDSDSGIFLRGSGKYQLNIWCWPIGSGEMYGVRMDAKMPAEVRAAVTPRTQADKPVGEWNHFEITVRGSTISVVLNGKAVIPGAQIPGLPPRGPIALQHHGGKKDGKWNSPPALVQFRNIFIKEISPSARTADRVFPGPRSEKR